MRPRMAKPTCMSDEFADIRTTRQGETVRVSVDQNNLAAHPPGWLARWVDSLSDRGCLPYDERQHFMRNVMDTFPLRLSDTYSLPFGHSMASNHIDLYPGQKIKVVGPVLADGVKKLELTIEKTSASRRGIGIQAKSGADLVGYEESWYSINFDVNGALDIDHIRTNIFRKGSSVSLDRPGVTGISFIPEGRFARMIYLTRVADRGDHDVLLVGALSRDQLETRSAIILNDSGQCLDANFKTWCGVVPNSLAINLYVTVSLCGVPKEVIPGMPIGQLLQREMGSQEVSQVPGLEVYRPPTEIVLPRWNSIHFRRR